MSFTENIQDFIGKYSVTGVLRERLEFESKQRAVLSEQLAAKTADLSKLAAENEIIQTKLRKAESELCQLHSTAPPMDLEMGAEIVLGQLSARPSGCTVMDIYSVFRDNGPSTEDAACWIDEFSEHHFVERVDSSEPPRFRLTPAGRSYARKYFAPRK